MHEKNGAIAVLRNLHGELTRLLESRKHTPSAQRPVLEAKIRGLRKKIRDRERQTARYASRK